MRAFSYTRVSTDLQEFSPEVQRLQIANYCQLKGYTLVETFEETGVSGSVPIAERPEGAAMLSRLSEVDAIVFSKLDRAFRSTVDAILTVQMLAEAGKTVHFLDMGIDTSTPAGQLCLQMMAAFAEFERKRISERVRESMAGAKRQGRIMGRAGFGFRNLVHLENGKRVDNGVHGKVDHEQEVIERIARWRQRGDTLRAIADRLNRTGVPTRRGGVWAAETVRLICRRMAS